jgi:hypothetical protein
MQKLRFTAAALSGRVHPRDDRVVFRAVEEAACRLIMKDRGLDGTQALWLDLLALLHHVSEECGSPRSSRALRHLGRNKIDSARRLLRRERERALWILRRRGVVIELHEILRQAQALESRDDLPADLLDLSRAFGHAALVAHQRGEASLSKWLSQRARLHGEHHRMLEGS